MLIYVLMCYGLYDMICVIMCYLFMCYDMWYYMCYGLYDMICVIMCYVFMCYDMGYYMCYVYAFVFMYSACWPCSLLICRD